MVADMDLDGIDVVAVGDLDGDGSMDVVSCDKEQVVAWFRSEGNGCNRFVLLERQGEGRGLLAWENLTSDHELAPAALGLRPPSSAWHYSAIGDIDRD